jgi:hypothetical protein
MAKLRVVDKAAKAADSKPAKGGGKPAKGDKVEKAAKAQKAQAVRKYKGEKSGKTVREFQNDLMAANLRKKLTDEQLAAAMREEFPHAVPYTVEHVRGIRSAYNKGKHGNAVPEKLIPEFDADGKALPLWGEKSKAKKDDAKSGAAKGAKKPAKKAAKPADDEEDEDEEEDEEE